MEAKEVGLHKLFLMVLLDVVFYLDKPLNSLG